MGMAMHVHVWPCGLMDKALVFGTKDCRFESCQGHMFKTLVGSFGLVLRSTRLLPMPVQNQMRRNYAWRPTPPHCLLDGTLPMRNTPGQDRTGNLQRVRLTS